MATSPQQHQPPARTRCDDDYLHYVPVHVVWEITLACDLKCLHCGSRAGSRRPRELSTEECLTVIDHLARLGTREISLIGGEAYLRRDWLDLIRAIRRHDIYCAIQTGGRELNQRRLDAAIDAGLQGLGVSLDGLETSHDRLRGVRGSFCKAIDTLRRAKAAGLKTGVNTQIGADTAVELPALMDRIIDVGATHWQVQLTVAMGNAVDHPELLLQPYQLVELMPVLARLYDDGLDRGLLMIVGNNVGYFGPFEHLWRGQGDDRVHWSGCSAGHTVLALEADGTVKGCPSLPTVDYAGGNVRDLDIETLWRTSRQIHFGRLRSVEDLWGFCRTCYYADVCRGGCTWTAHSLLGRPGNNPYCHYRALELQKQGLRERIVKVKDAPQASFAIGAFVLLTEQLDGSNVSTASPLAPTPLIELRGSSARAAVPTVGRLPTKLDLCRGCNCYVTAETETCPHCGIDVATSAADHATEIARIEAISSELRRLLALSDSQPAPAAKPSIG
jgi:Y-X(10)_GDL-associated radical SAM protein